MSDGALFHCPPDFLLLSSFFFFLMIRRPPRSTLDRSSAASDVYKRQVMSSIAAPNCACPNIPPPTGNNVSICQGQTIPALMVTIGSGLQANWYNVSTGGIPFATNTTSFIPTAAGTWYVETIDPATGCKSATRLPISLTINALPVAGITGDNTICSGTNLTLNGSGVGNYQWSNGGGTGTDATYNGVTTNTTYTLIVTNVNMCKDTASFSVAVTPTPTLSIGTIDCSTDFSTFDIEISYTNGDLLYDAGTLVGNTIKLIPITTNTVNIQVISSQNPECQANLTVSAPDCSCPFINPPTGNNVIICQGDPLPTLQVDANGLSANWYNSANGGVSIASNTLTFTPTSPGTWYVETFDPITGCKSNQRLQIILIIDNNLPIVAIANEPISLCAVSYTHLTLPTSDLV